MILRTVLFISILWFSGISGAFSQTVIKDSTGTFTGEIRSVKHEDLELVHSPKKATLLSVFAPGAGQIYNKKWWKAPIIWGGIGASIYASQINRNEYHYWKDQYVRRIDTSLTDDYPHVSDASLEFQMNTYRRWMETSYIVAGVIYVLQILDANVDAQLLTFDVSDDLSMNIEPSVRINRRQQHATYGLTLRFAFK